MEPFVQSNSTNTMHLQSWENRFTGLLAGFTTRVGGTSRTPYASWNMGLHVGDNPDDVVSNRRRLAKQLGLPFEAWTCADQVHGTTVQQVSEEWTGAGRDSLDTVIPGTDGLHTNQAGVLLTSFYADCVPLFFLDPRQRAIGLAHAGWRGTAGRIGEKMVEAFEQAYGSKREELLVAIGPSIGGCCYEVDERVIVQIERTTKQWQQAVHPTEPGKYLLDLGQLNRLLLLELGLRQEQISKTNWCTSCRTDLFYSHRKEAGKTGRMASFIAWQQEGVRKDS
ncbi:peptidoglycan editing factor PgeF [Brevibacillus fulvus]|uniref:Purine nucleoside phosphorylase n=1 Tax=Brevibacillus fulvus TaxID=1125967 RepID=A0A938XYP3_9BACL|nr:YfiH family protein [Brevibacillus fulvus]